MKKTYRKKKHNVKRTFRKKKQTFRKYKKTYKNRKISGGFTEENKGKWNQVVFNEDEKEQIKKYLEDNKNREVSSTEIRDILFPDISEKAKDNAAWEIQVILGRAYNGR